MKKPKNLKSPLVVSSQELVAINAAHAEAALAKERFHHAITKGHLLRALHDAAQKQVEINQYKAAESARLSGQQQERAEKDALTDKQAKEKHLGDLARDLRARYSVEDQFAIDPLSGEFLNPEA